MRGVRLFQGVPGGTSNPDSRVGKSNFLSDQNSDGNYRILLPSFRLLRKYNMYLFLTREDYFQSEFLSDDSR